MRVSPDIMRRKLGLTNACIQGSRGMGGNVPKRQQPTHHLQTHWMVLKRGLYCSVQWWSVGAFTEQRLGGDAGGG